ncbi:F-box domain-containing protein [Plectosphaerella cucumerina]|uniref:F-box domain-containing protein n=1 Tax=Plectosphaerella cucumerina TaxID=40658 RepID=A0A8K0T9A0_9PEZI|nr:F-box domain-containing protein [Plectosphaerella cucumerina]
MATSSSHQGASRTWSLDDLSSELLALILQHLRDVDLLALLAVRLVSRRFEALAKPIFYHVLTLNDKIVDPDADIDYPNLLDNVARHTNHVVARSDLDPRGIARVLANVRRLQSVRWCYVDAELRSGRYWLPADLLDPQHPRFRNTVLHVEGLPLRDYEEPAQDAYVRAIPTELLVSLKLASPAPPLTTKLNSLKQLLLRSQRLETFHYEGRGQGTNFRFSHGDRMPAFKNLTLKSYDWNHTREEVARHWDLSKLESLQLDSVPIFNFLASINLANLWELKHLHCEDFSAHLLTDRRQEATRGLHMLIKQYIKSLHTLSISCHTALFPLDAILGHAHSLEVLRFRDHVGFGEEDRRCPTLWPADLATLGRNLPNVHTLELDMDIALCDPPEFLRAVCTFQRLHTLTLHVQTVLHPLEVVHPGVDRDQDAAMRMLAFLRACKNEMAAWAPPGPEPWRRIVINVGGWRRVMVRRYSTAWRQQNENGVFAERCFVLERGPLAGGQLVFSEERPIETRSSTPTPERMLSSA